MTLICKAVESYNPEFVGHLKPMCEHIKECPEFKSCGYWENLTRKTRYDELSEHY